MCKALGLQAAVCLSPRSVEIETSDEQANAKFYFTETSKEKQFCQTLSSNFFGTKKFNKTIIM